MKNATKEKWVVAGSFAASIAWTFFEGLYEGIKIIGGLWAEEWRSASADWKIASAMKD